MPVTRVAQLVGLDLGHHVEPHSGGRIRPAQRPDRGVRTSNVAWMPVSRTCRSSPSRRCSTSMRSAPPSANTDEQSRQRSRAVVDAGEDRQSAPGLVLVTTDQAGHEAEVDVAARQHDARDPVIAGRDRARHQRGHADRAGALASRAWPDPSAAPWRRRWRPRRRSRSRRPTCAMSGPVISPGCFTAMPSASVSTGPSATASPQYGAHTAACTPMTRTSRQRRLHGDRDAGRESAAAERHDHAAPDRSMSSTSSSPSVPWPATTAGSSNGAQKVVPCSTAAVARQRDGLLDNAAPCSITWAP